MKTRIPELRRERKLSQEELARAVGTTRQTITSIEVGRYTASLPLAFKIAHYFGLTIEEVFDFSELEGEVHHGRVLKEDPAGEPAAVGRHCAAGGIGRAGGYFLG